MGNYLFDGDPAILVHEFYSRPYTVIGVDDEADAAMIEDRIKAIEEQLGYELERRDDDVENLRMERDEMLDHYPKQAGFMPGSGEFVA